MSYRSNNNVMIIALSKLPLRPVFN